MSYVNAALAVGKLASAYSQGKQDVADANAKGMALDYQADQEQQAAQQQAAIIQRASLYATSRETAAYAGSGVAVDGSGSAGEVVNQTRTDATHDAFMAILNGTKRADQLRANAAIVRAGGQVAQSNALSSGAASAFSTFASGWSTSGGSTSGLNSGNSYRGSGLDWFSRYANNDLSGTTRGSGD